MEKNDKIDISRRNILKSTMWGSLMLMAGIGSLEALASGADAAETVIPKELVYNPHWWKRVFAYAGAMAEVPYLEFGLTEEDHVDATEFFAKVDKMRENFNWGTRVVPIRQAIHHETEILPYQEFEELLMRSEVAGIGQCWCRSTFKNCDAPTNTCIGLVFPGNRLDLMNKGHISRVSKEEVREVIKRAEEAGLVHELIRAGDDDTYYVICNCCPCCCAGLRGFIEFGNKVVIKSDFVPEISDKCTGCGKCMDRCHFKARSIVDGRAQFDPGKCVGCGLCCTGCPEGASLLVKRTDGETTYA